ncbi:MAG: translocation/assembly module TamB, partial [Sphingobacteriia bacterium]|nr:translocation/assembly module TamB [Sphingobacteriia bacterium]
SGSLLLVLILMLAWMIGTQGGLRFAVALGAELAPGVLTLERIEGRLLGRASAERLVLRLGDFTLEASELVLDWSPLGVLSGTLRINELSLDELILVLPPGEDDADGPIRLPDLAFPIALQVDQARLARLALFGLEQSAPFLTVERIALVGTLRDGELALDHLAAALPEPQLTARTWGGATLRGDYPLVLDLVWTLTRAPAVALHGETRIGGDLSALAIQNRLSGSVDAELDAVLTGVLDAFAWDGEARVTALALPDFAPDLPSVTIGARLESVGDPRHASLTGRLDAESSERPDFGHLEADLHLDWADQVLRIRELVLTEGVSGAHLAATGHLDTGSETGSVALSGQWEGLRWPLSGDLLAESPTGELQVSGRLDEYRYELTLAMRGPELPESQLRVAGIGDLARTHLEQLTLQTLGGQVSGEAEVGWDPELSWTATLDASGLDPGLQYPAWPGRIAARLSTRGSLAESGLALTARLESLAGELRGYPIQASGGLEMAGETLDIQALEAVSGPSRLRLAGRIAERLELALELASPDLASLWPAAGGSLSARGTVSGARAAPRVLLDLEARELDLSGQGIAALNGRVALGIAPDEPFEIRLDGSALRLGELSWSRLAVSGAGLMSDHRVELTLVGEPLGVALAATGGRAADAVYRGRLTRLDLATGELGDWALQRPAPFSLEGARIAAGPLCLSATADAAGGCVELAQESAGRWLADLDLSLPDLARLAPLLPENLALTGSARLTSRLQANGAVLDGRAQAELPRGRLRLRRDGGVEQVLDLSGTRLDVQSSARALGATLALPVAELGRLDARLVLPGWRLDAPTRPGQPLDASLSGQLRGLERVADLVPDLSRMRGGIELDLGLGGTIGAPVPRGTARLSEVGFEVPLIGLRIADLNLTASAATRDRFDLQGHAEVGGGRLELSGEARLGGDGPGARLQIDGSRLKVADTREYFALVSPRLEIEAGAAGARLSGEVAIPEARIRPRSLPAGTQTPSSDVVLRDRELAAPYPLEIDLRLRLGDDVTIDAFGVRGRLAGDLALRQAPGREMLGDGQLQITDGQYRMSSGFGLAADLAAPLDIVQGRLVYARSPIGNPGLLLQAERDGGSTSAGVRVLGTLRDPKLAFFSESDPGMTQAEITKFLLTGVAPSRDGQAQTAGLAVGTYIAPKIYLEYESGLGGESNKVRLRYDLTNRIELQTETGESQGGDIFFTFER